MYIIPNETIQRVALSCLAETAGCDFSRSTQLAPGNLVRLDGPPALTSLDMVDTIPAYDDPNLSSCFVLSCCQTTPLTEYKDLEPDDISGTALPSLPRVPLKALTPHDAQDDVTPVIDSPVTPALRSILRTKLLPGFLVRLELIRIFPSASGTLGAPR